MKKRVLGNLEVSEIGVGCMGMSHAAGTPMDMDEAARVLRAAVDMGYTFFDRAKNYGFKDDPNHNEKILGKAFQGIRDKVVIAFKCGVDLTKKTVHRANPRHALRRAHDGKREGFGRYTDTG